MPKIAGKKKTQPSVHCRGQFPSNKLFAVANFRYAKFSAIAFALNKHSLDVCATNPGYSRRQTRLQAIANAVGVDLYRPSPYEIIARWRTRGRINRPHLRSPLPARHEGPDWPRIGVLAIQRRSVHGRFHTFTFSLANVKSWRTCSVSNADIPLLAAFERKEHMEKRELCCDYVFSTYLCASINYAGKPIESDCFASVTEDLSRTGRKSRKFFTGVVVGRLVLPVDHGARRNGKTDYIFSSCK